MSTVAIVNQKGGVGKTTTAINLGAALGALESRVLLIDCDPQANASRGLGSDQSPPLLYDALVGNCRLTEAVRPSGFPGLDLLPSDRNLVGMEVELAGTEGWESRLRAQLVDLDSYGTILLDCPPSLGHLTINALVAADRVLVPMQCEYFALEGVSELMKVIEKVRQALNPDLKITGIVLTMYDERTNLSQQVRAELVAHFPGLLFESIIPRNIRLGEAPSFGKPMILYDLRCRGSIAYLELAKEILTNEAERSRTRPRSAHPERTSPTSDAGTA